MSLGWIIVISCIAMVIKDAVYTFLTIAEARGRAWLAAILNALGTPATLVFYSYSGAEMLHGHGTAGWFGIIPIMCIDFIDGLVFTRIGNHIEPESIPRQHKAKKVSR